uniref:Uncharacterized protein n=1 Tax=Arion vulgaris TaxID=1028688 RepID=A0A0B7AEX5_9EUPU
MNMLSTPLGLERIKIENKIKENNYVTYIFTLLDNDTMCQVVHKLEDSMLCKVT